MAKAGGASRAPRGVPAAAAGYAAALGRAMAEEAAAELQVLLHRQGGVEVAPQALRHVGDARAHGLAVAAANVKVSRGQNVVVPEHEHSSNFYVWHKKAMEAGGSVRVVPRPADGDWTAAQRRIVTLFDRGEEGVHVDVEDAAMLAFLTDGKAEPVGAAGQIVALDEGFGWRAG